jgi:tetratricopeptide (TPR) repeat protein
VRRSFAAAALVATVCSAAAAQPRAKSPRDEAKEQYERGVVAYNVERFDEAIAAFTRAYELDPEPILLYNIAQARWKKGDNDRALFYYRRYLEADPAASNRAAVEARIQEIERARQPSPPPPPATAAPAAAPAPAPVYVQATPPPPAPPPIYRRPLFWAGVAAAAAAAVVTVVLISAQGPPDRCQECRGTIVVPSP